MISTLKEVREALDDACGGRCNAEYNPCWQRQAIDQLDALIAQVEKAEPVGEWKLVPIELTDEMIDAAWDSDGVDYVGEYKRINHIDLAYKAMLAVAPKAPQPAPPKEKAEPVAWMYPSDLEKFQTNETFAHAFSVKVGCQDELSVPLFDTPQSAPSTSQPLTDDEMWALWNAQGVDEMIRHEAIAFARAIEAAHGIVAKP